MARCAAPSCFLCATACPAHCIFIEAGEHPDPHVEKFPLRYEIDTLRCIYCGMCVEACPCDAIRMDTYVHPKIWGYKRADFIETKEVLMHRSKVLAERGRGALLARSARRVQAARPGGGAGRPLLTAAHRTPMGKVTIAFTGLSTVVLLVTFGKGMSILHGGDVASHLYWSMAALLTCADGEFRCHGARRAERPHHPPAAGTGGGAGRSGESR